MSRGNALGKLLEKRLEKAYIAVGHEVSPDIWAQICGIVCPELFFVKKATEQKKDHIKTMQQRARDGMELFSPTDSPPPPRDLPQNKKNKNQGIVYFLCEQEEENEDKE
jgi:hypothetical protein